MASLTTSRRTRHIEPPEVALGVLIPGGIAPAILAVVERGVRRRPALALGRVRVEGRLGLVRRLLGVIRI